MLKTSNLEMIQSNNLISIDIFVILWYNHPSGKIENLFNGHSFKFCLQTPPTNITATVSHERVGQPGSIFHLPYFKKSIDSRIQKLDS